jgi:hypothetical protein
VPPVRRTFFPQSPLLSSWKLKDLAHTTPRASARVW